MDQGFLQHLLPGTVWKTNIVFLLHKTHENNYSRLECINTTLNVIYAINRTMIMIALNDHLKKYHDK